jgi:hypothetical protein
MTTTMNLPCLRTEFPDFDIASLPAIPGDWGDVSWHNDACPKFTPPIALPNNGRIEIFIDAANPEDRENDCGGRFIVTSVDDNSGEDLLITDDWQAVLDLIANARAIATEHKPAPIAPAAIEAAKTTTLEAFRASRKPCPDLGATFKDAGLHGVSGFTYLEEGCYICEPGIEPGYYLEIENCCYEDKDLGKLEAILFDWAHSAGLIEMDPDERLDILSARLDRFFEQAKIKPSCAFEALSNPDLKDWHRRFLEGFCEDWKATQAASDARKA